jgi:hypothetical protein
MNGLAETSMVHAFASALLWIITSEPVLGVVAFSFACWDTAAAIPGVLRRLALGAPVFLDAEVTPNAYVAPTPLPSQGGPSRQRDSTRTFPSRYLPQPIEILAGTPIWRRCTPWKQTWLTGWLAIVKLAPSANLYAEVRLPRLYFKLNRPHPQSCARQQ